MIFTSLTLYDFILVKESGIQEMTVNFTEKVQVIIGTNGSGKSSTLRQLSPFPAVRSLFGKKGFKSLVIEKDGVSYRLETEYEKPSSPHLFFEGDSDENLNVGRTTETQKELIEHHLGVTPLVNDLIMNNYIFPKWTPSKRKEFLMGANPVQVGFVLGLIKQTSSKLKACKNNLARLQSRKILLEQDLLDDESLESITQEKKTLSDELGAFQQNLMDIEVGVRSLQDIPNTLTLSDLPGIRRIVKRCHYQLVNLSHISRDDNQRQLDRESTLAKIAVCTQQLVEVDEEILQQSTHLAELETRYSELSFEGDLHTVDTTIRRLESERDKLQIPRPPFELSREELKDKYQELDVLKERLHIFSNLTITLLPMKRRQHRERMLTSSQYKQSSYRNRLNDLEAQYESLSRQHSLSPKDIPDSPCAKERCPLWTHFMGEYQHSEGKRQSVSFSIEKGRRKIDRLDRYVEGLQSYLHQSQPYVEQIQWLVNHAQSNPVLHHILRQLDILSVLSTQPNRITRQLQEAYDRIEQWLKLKDILSDLETTYALKSRQISSESHDTIKLVTSIESTKKALYELRNAIYSISHEKRALEKLLSEITQFSDIKSTILSIQHQHQQMTIAVAHDYEKKRLDVLKKGVEELRSRHFLRLSDIERTLRAQTSLRDRYQEEVVSQIGLIEKELADLQQVESALIVIPKESMIDFINDVFEQANLLISSIWTVPLKLELLSHTDPLTYEFYVSGDNQSLREMSECSEGQTEILSLAINLSLRIILNHLNFPLCLDEPGRTMDTQHANNLIVLLKQLLDSNVISQLFMVSHHASIHNNFTHTETMVIREDNILLPEVYNQHVVFK